MQVAVVQGQMEIKAPVAWVVAATAHHWTPIRPLTQPQQQVAPPIRAAAAAVLVVVSTPSTRTVVQVARASLWFATLVAQQVQVAQ